MSNQDYIQTRMTNGTSNIDTAPTPPVSASKAKRVGFDAIDRLPLAVGPLPDVLAVAGRNASEAASSIFQEGARGAAIRRLLARDIILSRSQLRVAQGLKGVLLKKVSEGREGTHRLNTLERMVDNEHRRLLASIEALARLDSSPVIRVVAHQAAVMVGQGGQQP